MRLRGSSRAPPLAITDGDRRVGEALAGRLPRSSVGAASIVDEIPGYRDVSPELINDLRAGATATVEVLSRRFAEGSTVRREDVGSCANWRPRRVTRGQPRVFIRAYRVAPSPTGTRAAKKPRA